MPEENQSVEQQFLDELKPEDNFEKPLTEAPAEEKPKEVKEEESEGFQAKNRRERRLLEQNQRLREEAIRAETRLQTIEESKKARESTEEAEYLKLVDRIYGTDTPEKREATEILKTALRGAHSSAKKEALEEWEAREQSRSQEEMKAVQQEEDTLTEDEDYLAETRGANFDDPEFRKRYYAVQERLSRKDREGNIIEFADPDAVMDFLEATAKKPESRAKELAARNMVRSGQSQPSTLEDDANWRALKQAGIF